MADNWYIASLLHLVAKLLRVQTTPCQTAHPRSSPVPEIFDPSPQRSSIKFHHALYP